MTKLRPLSSRTTRDSWGTVKKTELLKYSNAIRVVCKSTDVWPWCQLTITRSPLHVLILVEFSKWNSWHFETLELFLLILSNLLQMRKSILPPCSGTISKMEAQCTSETSHCNTSGSQPECYRQFEHSWLGILENIKKKKGKAIPVTGRGGTYGCETSRFPHFLDNRLADESEVSLTRRPLFTPRKSPDTHFCYEAESTSGPQCGWKD
jgi:hypothetical protein